MLEVLVATTIVAVGVSALAQLVGIATHTQRRASHSTIAAVLAQEKIEELLAEDASTIASSPADALGHDVDGFAEFLDGTGHTMGGGPSAPPGSAYLRRWSIDSLSESRNGIWVLQVLVIDLRSRAVTRFTAAKAAKAF